MPSKINALFSELKTLALGHSTIQHVQLRGEEISASRGYLRLRLTLRSQDTVEVFVYLIDEDESLRLADYSLHWQRRDGALVKRWDSAPHHPEVAEFPHHIHQATGDVESGRVLDWESLITVLQREILKESSL